MPNLIQKFFVIASNRLGLAPEDCLVLEDSKNGILAAEGAEVPVVMVPDILPPTTELKEKTEAVFSTLHEVIDFFRSIKLTPLRTLKEK